MRKFIYIVLFFISSAAFASELTLDDYINAGLPAPSREWTGGDYLRTVQILGARRLSLPSYANDGSSKFVERMVSIENLSFYRNRSLPLQNRLGDYLGLQSGANDLLKVYFERVSKGAPLHTELADLLAFNLHIAALGIDLVNEYLPTIPKDNSYGTRMAGMKQMYTGMVTQFNGAEITLTENNGFSTSDRTAILNAMADTLPTLKAVFPSDFRSELRRKLEIDKRVLKGRSDSKIIDRMLDELKS